MPTCSIVSITRLAREIAVLWRLMMSAKSTLEQKAETDSSILAVKEAQEEAVKKRADMSKELVRADSTTKALEDEMAARK